MKKSSIVPAFSINADDVIFRKNKIVCNQNQVIIGIIPVSDKDKSDRNPDLIPPLGLKEVMMAIITPIEQYQDFLYLIGSVFVPLFAILLTDYFIFNMSVSMKIS